MNRASSSAAFTLPEMSIAAAVGGFMLLGLLSASITLQRGFSAAEHQIISQEDQMRVADYVSRDLRRATEIVIENSGRKLVLTLPDQTSDASTGALRVPSITGGRVVYGTNPGSVAYYVEGASFYREQAGARTVLSERIEEFVIQKIQPSRYTFELAFSPRFSRGGDRTALRAGNRVTCAVAVRNRRARL